MSRRIASAALALALALALQSIQPRSTFDPDAGAAAVTHAVPASYAIGTVVGVVPAVVLFLLLSRRAGAAARRRTGQG